MRTSVSCVILKIKPIDAVFFNTALLTRCGLAVLLFLEARETESPPSHKTTQAPPVWPPEGPVQPVSTPGGERPVPARSGAGLGHTGPSLAERKENSPTRKTTASVTGEYASFRLSHQANGFPKTRSGERCEKREVKGPGSPTGVPCRVTSPGRAGR